MHLVINVSVYTQQNWSYVKNLSKLAVTFSLVVNTHLKNFSIVHIFVAELTPK
jgi:hypothetical protein